MAKILLIFHSPSQHLMSSLEVDNIEAFEASLPEHDADPKLVREILSDPVEFAGFHDVSLIDQLDPTLHERAYCFTSGYDNFVQGWTHADMATYDVLGSLDEQWAVLAL